ncbi:MAG: hypothetical protein WKF37_08840 [Bryobacteraceae bacterium]
MATFPSIGVGGIATWAVADFLEVEQRQSHLTKVTGRHTIKTDGYASSSLTSSNRVIRMVGLASTMVGPGAAISL